MTNFQVVIIPSQSDMSVELIESTSPAAGTFHKLIDTRTREWAEDSHDEEEIEEILSEIWNSLEVVDGVHMVRTESETIIMSMI